MTARREGTEMNLNRPLSFVDSIVSLLFLLVLADAMPKQDPKKGPQATRMEMRSTPLKGGLPARTRTSPFPQDPSFFSFKNPSPSPRSKVKKPVTESPQGKKLCTTPECLLAVVDLMYAMNLTVDPCEDFYAYTCGNWIEEHPIPPTSNAMTVFHSLWGNMNERILGILSADPSADDSEAVQKAKTAYAACADTATLESQGLTPLTSFMAGYGGWPMTRDDWKEEDFDWQETVAAWVREAALNTLITASVWPSAMDTDKNVLYLEKSSLSLSARDLYLDRSPSPIVDAYLDLMNGTARLVRDSLGSDVADASIDEEVQEVFDFEKSLAEHRPTVAEFTETKKNCPQIVRADLPNQTEPFPELTLTELQAATDAVEPGFMTWTTFLTSLFAGTRATWSGNDSVLCPSPDFMPRLVGLLAATPPRTIANYLHWRLVYSLGDETNQAMRDLFFRFSMITTGITKPPEREYECAGMVNNHMGMAIGSVYVSDDFPPTAKKEVRKKGNGGDRGQGTGDRGQGNGFGRRGSKTLRKDSSIRFIDPKRDERIPDCRDEVARSQVEQLVEDLRAAFDGILDEIDWMDAATRENARKKNRAIRAFIGYPDFILDPQALADYYFGISMNRNGHLSNALSMLGWEWSRQAVGLNKPVDRDAWITHPTVVNAYYYPLMNSITFPAGILQSPFYQKGRLAAMNYGGIGMVIGHEITHGFDDSGRLFDDRGNLVDWWTEATTDAFLERAMCFVEQYNSYKIPELSGFLEDPHVNGQLTLGENIADNGGMGEAWFAYLKYIGRNGAEPSLPGLDLTPQQLVFVTFAYALNVPVSIAELEKDTSIQPSPYATPWNWCGHSTKEYLLSQILYDPHSPANFRVYGTLSNNAAFAKAFGCKADRPMFNGDDSCIMWLYSDKNDKDDKDNDFIVLHTLYPRYLISGSARRERTNVNLNVLTQLFLMVPADAATNQELKKRLEATRMGIRSTPLKGGLPPKTHIPPFPQDPSLFTFKNPTPKGGQRSGKPEVEKPVAESQQQEKNLCSTPESK
ncbi:unnamed protein product [Darwinula stevensoni]|uniref:Uncharacterized protein n=1 Tax=Darwinula stevensoni TaxID=69355 RepID=A0A7R8XKQ7_9CRUS|nr:unnamed protein product [Darwinula stevensoni]CAG0895500.1 unnamed protein product [Darwinula stevensoni]